MVSETKARLARQLPRSGVDDGRPEDKPTFVGIEADRCTVSARIEQRWNSVPEGLSCLPLGNTNERRALERTG